MPAGAAARLADDIRQDARWAAAAAPRVPSPQDLTPVAAGLHGHRTLEDLLAAVPRALCRTGGFGRVMVSRVAGRAWVPHAIHPAAGPAAARFAAYRATPIPFRHCGVEAELTRRRTPLLIAGDAGDVRACPAFLRDSGCTTYLAAPILSDTRVVGVLHVDRLGQDRAVDEADRELVGRLAGLVGDLWERLQLRRALDEQTDRFQRAVRVVAHGLADADAVALGDAVPEPAAAPAAGAPTRAARLEQILTRREAEILTLVATGATNGEIAARLGVAPATVKSHMKAIHRRLRVRSRNEAVAWLMRHDG